MSLNSENEFSWDFAALEEPAGDKLQSADADHIVSENPSPGNSLATLVGTDPKSTNAC